MEAMKLRALVMDGGSRQVLPVVRSLHALGCRVTTINGSRLDNGYASRYSDRRILIGKYPLKARDQNEVALNEVKSLDYDVLFPLSDYSMDFVTSNIEELSRYVKLPVAGRETFLRAYDKQITMEYCMDSGIPCPRTKRSSESLEDFSASTGYPIVAKPRKACGSMGLKIVRSESQLYDLIGRGVIIPEQYVIQEYIEQKGRQYSVHLFIGRGQEVKMALVTEKCRWFPPDGGASCMCRTVHREDVLETCVKLLDTVGWKGYCEVDLIEDPADGLVKVMEINGRLSANVKICSLAGMDPALQLLQLATGGEITEYTEYPDDIRMRCMHTDFLWFTKSSDRFSRKPSWFSMRNTHDQIFSPDDPLPLITFTLKYVPEYRSEMNKRKRT